MVPLWPKVIGGVALPTLIAPVAWWCAPEAVELYEGESLFFDVAKVIYEQGFCLQAVASAYQAPDGRTLRFDALFEPSKLAR